MHDGGLIERMAELEDVLTSVRAVCQRGGEDTAWQRLDARIESLGIGCVTAKTFKILPHEKVSP